jgi:hypothetical protein
MKNFRDSLLSAAIEAHNEGKISRADLIRLRFASRMPHVLKNIQETCEEQATQEGLVTSIEGINWEGLTNLLKEIIPLLMPLILKLLGM